MNGPEKPGADKVPANDLRQDFWRRILAAFPSGASRWPIMVATFALVGIIGVADYEAGFEPSPMVYYFIPDSAAVAAAG